MPDSEYTTELLERRTHLQGVVEVRDFTKVVQELVNPGLVVLDEGIKCDHVRFLSIGWLVGKIL